MCTLSTLTCGCPGIRLCLEVLMALCIWLCGITDDTAVMCLKVSLTTCLRRAVYMRCSCLAHVHEYLCGRPVMLGKGTQQFWSRPCLSQQDPELTFTRYSYVTLSPHDLGYLMRHNRPPCAVCTWIYRWVSGLLTQAERRVT
jgi:hypothetical protein